MPKLGSKDDIVAFAQKSVDAAIAAGKIKPDEGAAVTAAAVPSFSSGTLPLDPNTGKAIIPAGTTAPETPAIGGDTTVDPNATGALGATTEDDAAAQAAAAGAKAAPDRDPKTGQFVGEDKPPASTKPAVSDAAAPAARTEEQRAADAGAAAQAILDDEWSDLSFEHDDGSKYTVRAKKAEVKQVERFNRRQAMVDRATTYLNKWKPQLEPLIASGQMEPIFPLLKRALEDKEYGDFVIAAYNRRVMGQPLVPAVAPTVTAPITAAAPAVAAPAIGAVAAPVFEDQYLTDTVGPVLTQYEQRLAAQQARLDQWETQQRQQQEQAARQAEQNRQQAEAVRLAHMDIAQEYPTEFTGILERDDAALQPIFRYARDAGAVQKYGMRGGIVWAARRLHDERAAYAGSPAAAMIDQLDRSLVAGAAAQAAAARAVGAAAPASQPVQRRAPQPPSRYQADGKTLKKARDFMAEQQQYAQQVAASA
jgi:hypothetical protein